MWLLFHRNAKTKVVRDGHSFIETCPECGRKARFDEVEVSESYGVFFVDLVDDKERKYRCSACGDAFDRPFICSAELTSHGASPEYY